MRDSSGRCAKPPSRPCSPPLRAGSAVSFTDCASPAKPPKAAKSADAQGAQGGQARPGLRKRASALSILETGAEYDRYVIPDEYLSEECEDTAAELGRFLRRRDEYAIPEHHPAGTYSVPKFVPATKEDPFGISPEMLPPSSGHVFSMVDGVMAVWASAQERDAGGGGAGGASHYVLFSATDFFTDLHALCRVVNSGPVKTFCHRRLQLLEQRFSLHLMLNNDREFLMQKVSTQPGRRCGRPAAAAVARVEARRKPGAGCAAPRLLQRAQG